MIRRILKADEVSHDEPLELNIDAAPATTRATPRPVVAVSNVRITQTHADYAVIEVTCPCGKTTYVRCDYPAASPSPLRKEPVQA